MLIFLMSCFLVDTTFSVPLDEVEQYEISSIFHVSDRYLFVSRNEASLAVVNSAGKVLAKYKKRGQGPGELTYPVVLSCEKDEIVVISNDRHVISFDWDLKPDIEKYPILPVNISSEIYIYGQRQKDSFLVVCGSVGQASHLVKAVRLVGGTWKKSHEFFPQRKPGTGSPMEMLQNYRVNLHHQLIFKTVQSTTGEYEISVHSLPAPTDHGKDSEVIQMLSGDASEFPIYMFDARAFLLDSYKTRDGYALIFRVKSGSNPVVMADLFQDNGAFIKRIPLDSLPVPCINTWEVFTVTTRDGKEIIGPMQW